MVTNTFAGTFIARSGTIHPLCPSFGWWVASDICEEGGIHTSDLPEQDMEGIRLDDNRLNSLGGGVKAAVFAPDAKQIVIRNSPRCSKPGNKMPSREPAPSRMNQLSGLASKFIKAIDINGGRARGFALRWLAPASRTATDSRNPFPRTII